VDRRVDSGLCPTLLVVENQARVRLELTLGLGGRYDVAAVASAREALDLVALGAFFDVVVCELRMPEMNGVQLCEHLVEIESELASRVVLISDGVPDAGTRHALQALPNPCLVRPFETDALVDVLETCRTRSRLTVRDLPAGTKGQQRARQDAACVFALAVRLVRGEVLDLVDEQGWPWAASATTLQLKSYGRAEEWTTMVHGCAADVALEIVRRGLRSRDPRQNCAE
jgi:CheY-like chemotaxis protein